MKAGPKPKTAEGKDLRQMILRKEYLKNKKAEEEKKFAEYMTAFDSGHGAVAIWFISRMSREKKARFDLFAKEWNRKKLERVTSELSEAGSLMPEQIRPGFHRSPSIRFLHPGQRMDEALSEVSVENPFPPDIHSTGPYLTT